MCCHRPDKPRTPGDRVRKQPGCPFQAGKPYCAAGVSKSVPGCQGPAHKPDGPPNQRLCQSSCLRTGPARRISPEYDGLPTHYVPWSQSQSHRFSQPMSAWRQYEPAHRSPRKPDESSFRPYAHRLKPQFPPSARGYRCERRMGCMYNCLRRPHHPQTSAGL